MAESQMTPRTYVREVPPTRWYFRHPRYMRYIAREVTCIFIGAYTALLIVGVAQLSRGSAAWEALLAALQAPASIAFHLVALAFALYHTITWFNVTPKALPVQIGEHIVPAWTIVAAHYAVWVVLSMVILLAVGVL